MTFFYWFSITLGIVLAAFSAIKQKNFSQTKRLIEPYHKKSNTKELIKIDYEAIIIKNSRFMVFLDDLDKQLIQKLKIFAAAALIALILKWTGTVTISLRSFSMISLLIMVAVIILPGLIIKPMVSGRLKAMMDSLPYFIDLVAVCVQSGMTVESSLKYISERFVYLDRNLAALILQVVKRADVSGLEEALHELYRSMTVTEIKMFSATLQQSVHYGTSLYENLMELSKDIRELQLLTTEENIGKLSARMSVPLILFIMFPITVLIAAPGILRIMQNGLF